MHIMGILNKNNYSNSLHKFFLLQNFQTVLVQKKKIFISFRLSFHRDSELWVLIRVTWKISYEYLTKWCYRVSTSTMFRICVAQL
jgi:hypothetical protein